MARVISIVQNVPTSAPQMPASSGERESPVVNKRRVEDVVDQPALFQPLEPLDLLVGDTALALAARWRSIRPLAN